MQIHNISQCTRSTKDIYLFIYVCIVYCILHVTSQIYTLHNICLPLLFFRLFPSRSFGVNVEITSNPPLFILSTDLEARTHVLRHIYILSTLLQSPILFYPLHSFMITHQREKKKKIKNENKKNYTHTSTWCITFPELFNRISLLQRRQFFFLFCLQ